MPKRYPIREFTGTTEGLEQFLQEQSAKGLNVVSVMLSAAVDDRQRHYVVVMENVYG